MPAIVPAALQGSSWQRTSRLQNGSGAASHQQGPGSPSPEGNGRQGTCALSSTLASALLVLWQYLGSTWGRYIMSNDAAAERVSNTLGRSTDLRALRLSWGTTPALPAS